MFNLWGKAKESAPAATKGPPPTPAAESSSTFSSEQSTDFSSSSSSEQSTESSSTSYSEQSTESSSSFYSEQSTESYSTSSSEQSTESTSTFTKYLAKEPVSKAQLPKSSKIEFPFISLFQTAETAPATDHEPFAPLDWARSFHPQPIRAVPAASMATMLAAMTQLIQTVNAHIINTGLASLQTDLSAIRTDMDANLSAIKANINIDVQSELEKILQTNACHWAVCAIAFAILALYFIIAPVLANKYHLLWGKIEIYLLYCCLVFLFISSVLATVNLEHAKYVEDFESDLELVEWCKKYSYFFKFHFATYNRVLRVLLAAEQQLPL